MATKAQSTFFVIFQLVLSDTCTENSLCSKLQANNNTLGPLRNICKFKKWRVWNVNPVFFKKVWVVLKWN